MRILGVLIKSLLNKILGIVPVTKGYSASLKDYSATLRKG